MKAVKELVLILLFFCVYTPIVTFMVFYNNGTMWDFVCAMLIGVFMILGYLLLSTIKYSLVRRARKRRRIVQPEEEPEEEGDLMAGFRQLFGGEAK